MTTVQDVCEFLESMAPESLAETWDNVGLLIGRKEDAARRIMTCLTVTPESVLESVERDVDLIVSHHPTPFQPLKQITDATTTGGILLDLIANNIAVYSPHTAFDSAGEGINQLWTDRLKLTEVLPIEPNQDQPDIGTGRSGSLPESMTLSELGELIKREFSLAGAHLVGDPALDVSNVAIACGAAGTLLDAALEAGCNVLITGETNFHTCLEAKARGAGLILTGHYGSERFGVEHLAAKLATAFPISKVWPSHRECDPVLWI